MVSAPYSRAVALAALQAVLTSTWIAARELSPARRRLTRLGAVAAVTAVGWAVTPGPADSTADDDIELIEMPFPVGEPPEQTAEPRPPFDKRKAVLAAGVAGLSLAAIAGRRQLEKRWLARLTRNGHPHPTRALAVRVAAVEFAGHLALQLAEARRSTTRQD